MVTVQEFRALFQKNLNELIWRNRGWGPIPIHGKGEKGFNKQSRLEYNISIITSMEAEDDKLDKANQLLVARTDKLNDMLSKGQITRGRKDKIIDNLSKTFEQNVEKRKQLHAQIAQKQKVIDKLQSISISARGYKRFTTESEMTQWADNHYKNWSGSLTEKEKDVLKDYKGNYYHGINNKLRGAEAMTPTVRKDIGHMDAALKKDGTPQNVITYRGFEHAELYANYASLIGTKINDNAFISSSLDKGIAVKFLDKAEYPILTKIKVPKGTKAGYLDMIYERHEYELLLSHGTSFKVTKSTKVGKVVELELEIEK